MNDQTVIRPGGRGPRRRVDNAGNGQDRTVVRPGHNDPTNSNPSRFGSQSSPLGDTVRSNYPPMPPSSASQPLQQPTYTFADQSLPQPPLSSEPIQNSSNPILDLTSPLISLIVKVQNSIGHPDIEELKRYCVESIQYFQHSQFGLPQDPNLQSIVSYGLCSFVDEMVLNTPWGSTSSWSNESLLVLFHHEAWGGERFFEHLDYLSNNSGTSLLALEFYYIALDLGFEGKYRQIPNGIREQQQVKANTLNILSRYKNFTDSPLSTNWEGVSTNQNSLNKTLPQWVIWCLTGGFLLLVYIALLIGLNQHSQPVLTKYNQKISEYIPSARLLPSNYTLLSQRPIVTDNSLERISKNYYELLNSELRPYILEGLIELDKMDSGLLVRLIGDKQFQSASASISTKYEEIVLLIGESLEGENIRIEVTGHTDNVPIRTLRFPNNWILSTVRAESIKSILAESIPDSNISARGLADTQPLAKNTSVQNKALNRRVEILIKE